MRLGIPGLSQLLKATRGDVQDLMGEQVTAKTKAMQRKFAEMCIYGYYNGGAGYDAKGFDGLHALIKSQGATATEYDNTVCVATVSGTGILLSLAKLEQAVDYIKGGKPDLILMSKAMRRAINKYMNGVGGVTKVEIQGKTVQTLFDIPIAVSDWIIDTEDATKDYGDGTYGFDYTVGRLSQLLAMLRPLSLFCALRLKLFVAFNLMEALRLKSLVLLRLRMQRG